MRALTLSSEVFLLFFIFSGSWSAFFDYTDFEDPFQLLWNARDQVITDSNTPCSGNVGNIPTEGVCKPRTECQLTGGVSAGSCGILSTCCVYMGSCGSKMSAKIAYFRRASTTTQQSCVYQVKLHNRNICQLRVEFVEMILAPPAREQPLIGTCRDERFFVEGYPNLPLICGKNSGQHMFIPVNGSDTTVVKLHIDVLPRSASDSAWTIKVTQLQCPGTTIYPYRNQLITLAKDFPLLAPQNCLQYFTDLKGAFRNFGFDVLNPGVSTYNVNQTYAICFKRHSGFCSISFSMNYFQVGNPAPDTSDYLYIPASKAVDGAVTDERISGQQIANTYYTSATPGPFYVYFLSDSNSDGATDLGFDVKYELRPQCT